MSFYVGLDLGKEADPSALAVVEQRGRDLHLRHLERYPLGTPYPVVVDKVDNLLRDPRLAGAELVVDATGVGSAVTDMLRERGLRFVPVTLTGGEREHHEGGSWQVPKTALVSALDVALSSGRLKAAEGLPLWPTMRDELLAFRRKIDERTAHVSYQHRTKAGHGDLVIATALACWWARRCRDFPA
jgi:hypothetical protein